MRLSLRVWIVLGAALGILIVFATDQVIPPATSYQAQMRLWLAARATGITGYLLLTALVSLGLILSHPTNQSTWKLSKMIFPWHENLFVFVVAFTAAHVISLILDPYANVGVEGTFIPGLSQYRNVPVALGTLAMYAALLSGVTARWTRLLPKGVWLKLHRLALVGWILAWIHGLLAGADSTALLPMYTGTGVIVIASGAYRYWVSRKSRTTFASSLPGGGRDGRPLPIAAAPGTPSPTSGPRGAASSIGERDAEDPASSSIVRSIHSHATLASAEE